MIAFPIDPDAARRAARQILSDRRFRRDPAPRPLRGPLRWIGDRLHGLAGWLGRVVSLVPALGWLAIALVVVGLIVARLVREAQHRRLASGDVGAHGRIAPDDDREDPRVLERAADEAERDGDLDRALRLRFRAGLVRLGDRGAIRYRPSLTTGEVRRDLGSETFDELARTFERVAYGGRAASPPDMQAARAHWPRVLDEVGGRL